MSADYLPKTVVVNGYLPEKYGGPEKNWHYQKEHFRQEKLASQIRNEFKI